MMQQQFKAQADGFLFVTPWYCMANFNLIDSMEVLLITMGLRLHFRVDTKPDAPYWGGILCSPQPRPELGGPLPAGHEPGKQWHVEVSQAWFVFLAQTQAEIAAKLQSMHVSSWKGEGEGSGRAQGNAGSS